MHICAQEMKLYIQSMLFCALLGRLVPKIFRKERKLSYPNGGVGPIPPAGAASDSVRTDLFRARQRRRPGPKHIPGFRYPTGTLTSTSALKYDPMPDDIQRGDPEGAKQLSGTAARVVPRAMAAW